MIIDFNQYSKYTIYKVTELYINNIYEIYKQNMTNLNTSGNII